MLRNLPLLLRCIAGDTLAHVAASMGNIDALDVLLREQVDFNALNSNGATPLHVAKDSSTIKVYIHSLSLLYKRK